MESRPQSGTRRYGRADRHGLTKPRRGIVAGVLSVRACRLAWQVFPPCNSGAYNAGLYSWMTRVKKTDLEKNKGLKIANSMKQAGAKRPGPAPKTRRPQAAGKTGLLGKLLGKALPPEKDGD